MSGPDMAEIVVLDDTCRSYTFHDLDPDVIYGVWIRKACRYATFSYDILVRSDWSAPLGFRPLGIESADIEERIILSPNPTSGRVTVVMNGRPLRELYVAGMDGIAEPLPFSALGDGRYAADLTDRPDGAYVLVMISDDKHAYRSTVILQR